MVHELKLHSGPFDAIKAGTKTIECRLYDEKRQQIQIGDALIFRRAPELEESVTVEVTGLLYRPNFSDLFADFAPEIFGGKSVVELEDLIYSFYSKADEAKFGVLGIQIKMVV